MHLLVQDTRTLDEEEAAVDLGQTPADIVLLSFSDSDLGAAASAWHGMADPPGLRPANLARLRHPMSVDLYLDSVISGARCVILRLLGGLEYWRYGAEEFSAHCRARGVPLAILSGDARDDAALADLGTVTPEQRARLDGFVRQGGPENWARALRYAAHLAGLCADAAEAAEPVAFCGVHRPMPDTIGMSAVIVFYRSHLLAGDLAPITALMDALTERGMAVAALYVASLKDPDSAAFVADRLRHWRPAVVLNATAFASGGALAAAGVAVLQVVLAGSSREAWEASPRGLSQTDLAMHVVLPELDGHLLTTAISFKVAHDCDPDLQFARAVHRPDDAGVALAADRAAAWVRLANTPRAAREVGIVLSDYPGGGQRGHAVGLDTIASVAGILGLLRDAGYETAPDGDVTEILTQGAPTPILDLLTYRRLFAALPEGFRGAVLEAWGDPAPRGDWFDCVHVQRGRIVVAIQPDRGSRADRKAGYHDPDTPPCHAYVAFYLWLRQGLGIHAMVQLGAHGTLEWLPGKSAALSSDCAPAALTGGLPVIYPFIVNNPGEAAAAKRRLGAVMIGHLTPKLTRAGLAGDAAALESLIDEFAAADGMDRRRVAALRRQILRRAEDSGLLAESGVIAGRSDDAALARLDAYLCDVKDMQIRDGLHVFGQAPQGRTQILDMLRAGSPDVPVVELAARLDASAPCERDALLAALDGRFIAPGPAGAPSRGRADVLPTGRNLFTVDPRAIPTRSAVALAEPRVTELVRLHVQEAGDWPRRLVIDVWGSATMRTGGEDFALALLLLGVRPVWDDNSGRVTGFEIVPLALLDRPRIDVTLRISGLFRDAFEAQARLFDSAVRAVAARDEAADFNPLAASGTTERIYGPAPGCYGAGTERILAEAAWQDRAELGAAYLAASGFGWGQAPGKADADGFAARVRDADALVHTQDHAETDVLENLDQAGHIGGFAAAATLLGASPVLYYADISDPAKARFRTVADEITRVVRGRAANPAWIAGMTRHGYRGASEIARALDALAGFAATLPHRFDRQFDLMYDATLGDAAVDRFLSDANPDARAAMLARFNEMQRRGLWHPRRNAIAAAA